MNDPNGKPGSWSTLQESLRERGSAEGRLPFFPISQVGENQPVMLNVLAGPFFEGLHGQYSLVEMDVRHGSTDYRLCASGARLAAKLASAAPQEGDTITLTAKGSGKDRTWTVTKV